jgi:murein DD-endopeptidase MepM/ murein hydrolase activator NlpD
MEYLEALHMPTRILPARVLAACALTFAFSVSSQSPALASVDDAAALDPPQASTLLAPFSCGTEWQGSTYHGHGSNNWNLDLNRSDNEDSDLGEPVLAQADGTVVWFKQTGYNNRAGTYVEIDYGEVTVRYIHLIENSIPDHLAEVGALVASGETIGLLGATGRVSGPHLHLEYWDSADHEDSAWYQLPRGNHIPVALEGQVMIATPNQPSPVVTSTNCPATSAEDRLRDLRLWRYVLDDSSIAPRRVAPSAGPGTSGPLSSRPNR